MQNVATLEELEMLNLIANSLAVYADCAICYISDLTATTVKMDLKFARPNVSKEKSCAIIANCIVPTVNEALKLKFCIDLEKQITKVYQ